MYVWIEVEDASPPNPGLMVAIGKRGKGEETAQVMDRIPRRLECCQPTPPMYRTETYAAERGERVMTNKRLHGLNLICERQQRTFEQNF
jgi:hypothetical protein